MAKPAISIHNVSKCYQPFDSWRSRLLHVMLPTHTRGMQEVWALKNINFEVKRGESFAVIGRNGSGKSTLLQIITQTLTPTTGRVTVSGRVAALLELGSGFNPEYTGRENVFLNGLLLGLTRAEVAHRFDDIAAFADIGNVLDRQVKTYSSGMLVRLAFAVQIALDPDILIVDEALSVGDYFFQQKCFGRLRQMRENGLTLLFVSHDMGTVRDLCKQAVYLRHGEPEFVGDSGTAIKKYFSEGAVPVAPTPRVETPKAVISQFNALDAIRANACWSRPPAAEDRILAVRIVNEQAQDIDHARIGDRIFVRVYYRNLPDDLQTTVTLTIKNRYDQIVFAVSAAKLGCDISAANANALAVFTFELTLNLESGLFSLRNAVTQPTGHNKGLQLDATDWYGPFRIDWDYEAESAPFLGMFGLPATGNLSLVDQTTI